MKKEMVLLNLTSHKLEMADAAPASLTERRVDSTLDIFYTINGIWIDETEEVNGYNFSKRHFELNTKEIEKLVTLIKEKYNDLEDKLFILLVSLPVGLNYSKTIETVLLENGINSKVAGIIQATNRSIKPPVACMKHFSVF